MVEAYDEVEAWEPGRSWERATAKHPARRTYVRLLGSWLAAVAAAEVEVVGRPDRRRGPGRGAGGGCSGRCLAASPVTTAELGHVVGYSLPSSPFPPSMLSSSLLLTCWLSLLSSEV
jgi:hypothetical protein